MLELKITGKDPVELKDNIFKTAIAFGVNIDETQLPLPLEAAPIAAEPEAPPKVSNELFPDPKPKVAKKTVAKKTTAKKTTTKQAPAPAAEVAVDSDGATVDEAKDAMRLLSKAKGVSTVMKVLEMFEAKSLGDVEVSEYQNFVNACAKAAE